MTTGTMPAASGFSIGGQRPCGRALRAGSLLAMLGAIALAHYLLPRHSMLPHDLLRRATYLPIIVAAFWFGTRGGVAAGLAAAVLYAPHLFFQHTLPADQEVDRTLEMVLYVLVGGLTGILVERERWQRARTARALEELRERSEELVRLQHALSRAERLSVLGELLASLAHEVRNPLATLRGAAQVLADDPPPEERRELAGILTTEIDRLDGVLAGYLRMGREPPPGGGRCEVRRTVEAAVALLRPQLRSSGIRIHLRGASHAAASIGEAALTQILVNLLLNAVQATGPGGRIEVEIEHTPQAQGREIGLRIRDDGPGIAEPARQEIFRPFYTTRADGTGLGLAIARRTAQAHGGSLVLESTSPAGSTFRLTLPAARETS